MSSLAQKANGLLLQGHQSQGNEVLGDGRKTDLSIVGSNNGSNNRDDIV